MTIVFTLVAGAIAAAATMTAAALRARQSDRVSIVDTAWGLGFVLATFSALAVALSSGDGDDRRLVLTILVTVWGVRLAGRIHLRARQHRRADGRLEEDFRYAELLDGRPFSYAVRHVFGIQGASLWLVSTPVLVGMATDTRWTWVLILGATVWLVGFLFEAIGDAQLDAYKRMPDAERPPVMDRGLWAWTRHPNYFGDACVWWGLWLAGGLASGPVAGAATVVAPIAMTYFVVFATGARHLERSMMRRTGYPEYAARTPMVLPRRPRRG